MIYYSFGYSKVNVKTWLFPDGGVGVNINQKDTHTDVDRVVVSFTIDVNGELGMNDEIVALGQTMDALKTHFPFAQFTLYMPYIPYARQDRVCQPGEGHSLRFFAKTINAMGFSRIVVVDPHSTVSEASFNNIEVVSPFDVFKNIKLSWHDTYIVAPDQGAWKKAKAFADQAGAKGVIRLMKDRVDRTVKIQLMDEIPEGSKLLVLDDICDAGGTFVALAEAIEMESFESLDLAVTHGLFTKGTSQLSKWYDNIYTTDSVISTKDNVSVICI